MQFLYLALCSVATVVGSPSVELQPDQAAKKLVVLVDGQPALTYQYGDEFALPHYWPVLSPTGKQLTIQHPEPYPHHRSIWIADKVQAVDGPAVDFYHCWKNLRSPSQPADGFRHFIRHERFDKLEANGATARVVAELQWIVDDTRPVLDERRDLRIVALGDGEYFVDLRWKLTASSGEVKFLSDGVHYAWPYVRMHPQFSGAQGGVIVNDRGQQGQAETNDATANWIDYSNSVDGETEGLALFIYPDDQPHRWLTREYGTFGPRRSKQLNGTKFTLAEGESLQGRVGIYVHRGDAKTGNIGERYRQYIEDQL